MSIDPKASYYDIGNIEVMRVIEAKLTKEQFEGFLLGNILKYSMRANYKGDFKRDIEKVRTYSEMLSTKDIKLPDAKPATSYFTKKPVGGHDGGKD
jgi:hypothetical protein